MLSRLKFSFSFQFLYVLAFALETWWIIEAKGECNITYEQDALTIILRLRLSLNYHIC